MTELQLGLIGLGATAVVGVLAYNKWQEYRHRKLAEAVFKPPHDDILFGAPAKAAPHSDVAGRSEPEIHGEEDAPLTERLEPMFADPRPVAVPVEKIEPVIAPVPPVQQPLPIAEPVLEEVPEWVPEVPAAPVAPVAAPLRTPPPAPAPQPAFVNEVPAAADDEAPEVVAGAVPTELLDPRLEFIVAMELVEAVPAAQILRSQRDVLHRLNKPVHWVGFNERTREWERLLPGSELPVRRLRVGLQLVNRLGPVAEGDVGLFIHAMHALADELMAVADMPSSRVLDQAAEIDRFCAAVDLEIGINLVSRGSAFAGTKIRALAEAAGMVLGVAGLFTRYDDDGHALFSLQNYESTQFSPETVRGLTTHGLTFLLDVPRVDHGERVFMQMAELAKRFADALQGALVDDNRQPLSDSQLDHIRREFVGKPQAAMASFGLPAGSAQAQRLFS